MLKIGFTEEALGEGGPAHVLNKLAGLTFDVKLKTGESYEMVEIYEADGGGVEFGVHQKRRGGPVAHVVAIDDIEELTYL